MTHRLLRLGLLAALLQLGCGAAAQVSSTVAPTGRPLTPGTLPESATLVESAVQSLGPRPPPGMAAGPPLATIRLLQPASPPGGLALPVSAVRVLTPSRLPGTTSLPTDARVLSASTAPPK
jgi:hypothetical protein